MEVVSSKAMQVAMIPSLTLVVVHVTVAFVDLAISAWTISLVKDDL